MARFSERKSIHKKLGETARYIVKKFRVQEMTGLPLSDALTVIEDLMDSYVKNINSKESFLKTRNRALFLPHCSRKFMDNRCQADFDPETSSYSCNSCSSDCLINKATRMAEKKGYDVYVVPGGSCLKKLIPQYDGIVGVACTEEIKMAWGFLENQGIPAQAVPLTKNGCSGTKFSLETLRNTL